MNKNFSARYQSNHIQNVAPTTSLRGKLKCQFLHALYANDTLFHVVDDWGGIISTNHTAVWPLKITWCQPWFKDVFCGKVSYFWDVFPELQGKYLCFSNWLTLIWTILLFPSLNKNANWSHRNEALLFLSVVRGKFMRNVLTGCMCFVMIGHLIVCAMLIGWFKFSDVLLTAYTLSTDRTEHFTIYLTYSPVGSIFFPTPTGQNQGTGPFTKVLVDTQSQLPTFKLLSASNWNSSKTYNNEKHLNLLLRRCQCNCNS